MVWKMALGSCYENGTKGTANAVVHRCAIGASTIVGTTTDDDRVWPGMAGVDVTGLIGSASRSATISERSSNTNNFILHGSTI